MSSKDQLSDSPGDQPQDPSEDPPTDSPTEEQHTKRQAIQVLTMNTIAFTVNFAAWMMYGVLITFLIVNNEYDWTRGQIGWLIGIPVLTGALLRLPVGILTDMYGGRIIFTVVMILAAIPMFLVSMADSFWAFFALGLGFGLTGTTFAVGIAYTSVWFSKEHQGFALGIFGAGNAGAALTAVFAPMLLNSFTDGGTNIDGWRLLPRVYAVVLVVMAILFWFLTYNRKATGQAGKTLVQRLEPLRHMRVWRFGLYYFLVFGGFVALAQWLVPYYVNVYSVTLGTAGLLTAIFSFPSGVIRALGGWMSDFWGARNVMYWILGIILVACILLLPPVMDVISPGEGVTAIRGGTVIAVGANYITVNETGVNHNYTFDARAAGAENRSFEDEVHFLPVVETWQEPNVDVGDTVKRKSLLAKGNTKIYFQANIYIFTALVFAIGITMGIGKAAVYKHIPEYFPDDVGVTGGIVGVLGGLGGFISPVIFGYMLDWTGLWTSTWLYFAILAGICLIWMHLVIKKMMRKHAPALVDHIEDIGENQGSGPEGIGKH